MRLPNRRPCMSVNAVTTVSIAPAFACSPSSCSESIPATTPGPPGRGALIARLLRAAAERRSGRRLRRHLGRRLDHVTELVRIDRPHRARVAVLGRYPPPDPHEQTNDQDQRRVAERFEFEVAF